MDSEEEHQQELHEEEEKYPNRPHNHGRTWPFHTLFTDLFNPLNENKKKPTGPAVARRRAGPHGASAAHLNPQERRRDIISRFISRWRADVGDDIYPAFRLIIPDKDRDRAMYGLKEKAIAKLLIKVMKINRDSEDGQLLMNWKLPGRSMASSMAGDFAGRCYEVISKRPLRAEVGDMTIEEVNKELDKLSVASKEHEQLPIFTEFYRRMNPEELMWLIRIVLRQMKIGATERTFFNLWHPDAENLFSVSSSLRRVCWELWDPNLRLEGDEAAVTLMQCFQPQLAQFQMHSFEKIIARMRLDPNDPTFWIEEKMDGERMQLHMDSDNSIEGGRKFQFWSRKAKDYSYLYGNSLYDENGALARHLKDAFVDGVESIILDGEMITWDPEQDAPVPFGTLKTAALQEQRNPFATGNRPLFRVFDILYLNGKALTRYTLRDRRRALEACIRPVHRRFEIHPYNKARTAAEVEPYLRTVVAEASEGLVLKNPNSPYRLNERHDDWMKVKPEYMTEFGESLDLIVVGGYYGSGRRGGNLSSFLCGLRVDEASLPKGANPQKCYSFCKIGGGFSAQDYASLRHKTEGKWHEWDPKKPPTEYIELGGGRAQLERPDMWIKPEDSFVVCVKAASVNPSDSFRIGLTVRFPRLKMLRPDKDWKSALSVQEFMQLKTEVEEQRKEKEFSVDDTRKRRATKRTKKELTIAGYDQKDTVEYKGPVGKLFQGMNFCIMTEHTAKPKKSKAELEQIVKANGGKTYQTNTAAEDMYCIADRRTVKVAAIQKSATQNIIRPLWLLDCTRQVEKDKELGQSGLLLPLEPRHMLFTRDDKVDVIAENVDRFSDSYARDVDVAELTEILESMATPDEVSSQDLSSIVEEVCADTGFDGSRGWLFKNTVMYFAPRDDTHELPLQLLLAKNTAIFGDAKVVTDLTDESITHIVADSKATNLSDLRKSISKRSRLKVPHLVSSSWIQKSWNEKTMLDEQSESQIVQAVEGLLQPLERAA